MIVNNIKIRLLREEDIPFAMRLKNLAGWNQVEDDWRGYLLFEPTGCFLAALDGEAAGTATAITYEKRFAWVGMVLVDPAKRRQGIGTALLEKAISFLQDCEVRAVKLDATPMGKKVYLPMGFVDEYSLCRYEGRIEPAEVAPETALAIERIIEADLDALTIFDAAYFGAPRGKVLAELRRRHPEYALYIKNNFGITGYIMARKGYEAFQIGPWVARDIDAAEELLRAILRGLPGGRVLLDVPVPNESARRLMERFSFQVQRVFDRMYLGENEYPGRPERVFATSSAEKG